MCTSNQQQRREGQERQNTSQMLFGYVVVHRETSQPIHYRAYKKGFGVGSLQNEWGEDEGLAVSKLSGLLSVLQVKASACVESGHAGGSSPALQQAKWWWGGSGGTDSGEAVSVFFVVHQELPVMLCLFLDGKMRSQDELATELASTLCHRFAEQFRREIQRTAVSRKYVKFEGTVSQEVTTLLHRSVDNVWGEMKGVQWLLLAYTPWLLRSRDSPQESDATKERDGLPPFSLSPVQEECPKTRPAKKRGRNPWTMHKGWMKDASHQASQLGTTWVERGRCDTQDEEEVSGSSSKGAGSTFQYRLALVDLLCASVRVVQSFSSLTLPLNGGSSISQDLVLHCWVPCKRDILIACLAGPDQNPESAADIQHVRALTNMALDPCVLPLLAFCGERRISLHDAADTSHAPS